MHCSSFLKLGACNKMYNFTPREDPRDLLPLLFVSLSSTGSAVLSVVALEHWLGVANHWQAHLVCNSTLPYITIIGIPGWPPTGTRQSEFWVDAHLRLIWVFKGGCRKAKVRTLVSCTSGFSSRWRVLASYWWMHLHNTPMNLGLPRVYYFWAIVLCIGLSWSHLKFTG